MNVPTCTYRSKAFEILLHEKRVFPLSYDFSLIYKFLFRRSSVGTFIRQQPLTSSGSSSVDSSRGSKTSTTAPRLDYRSMVSVEDMPELFVSFDSKYHCVSATYSMFTYFIIGMNNLIFVKISTDVSFTQNTHHCCFHIPFNISIDSTYGGKKLTSDDKNGKRD